MRRFAPLTIGAVGLLVFSIATTLLIRNTVHGLTDEDVKAVFKPLVNIPLDSIDKRPFQRTRTAVPDTAQWQRVRREWGSPEFVISAVSLEREYAYCLRGLQMTINVFQDGRPIPLKTSYPPYGYSADCPQPSLRFQAGTGREIQVEIAYLSGRTLPKGRLVFMADWPYEKDKLVGQLLERDLLPGLWRATIFGAILIALALYLRQRARGTQR
jgi:hypothetical protein